MEWMGKTDLAKVHERSKTMEIRIADIRIGLQRAWESVTDADNAQYIAERVVATHMRKDARINAIRESLEDLEKCLQLSQLDITLVRDSRATRVYDFNKVPGILHMKRINDEAVDLAKAYGVSAIGIGNTGGVHTLDTWVTGVAERDLIGAFAWNGGSYGVVAYGSAEPFFGTNPIAYAIPTNDRPIILDMATSEIPFMNLVSAIKQGKMLEYGRGVDEEGRPTRDPNEVYDLEADTDCRLLPMGAGYKGSAIMLLVEVLTGALVGATMSREAIEDPAVDEFGGIFFCIDISSFTDLSSFKSRVSTMAQQIRQSKPAHGLTEVSLPGDGGYKRERRIVEQGFIVLEDELVNRINELGRG